MLFRFVLFASIFLSRSGWGAATDEDTQATLRGSSADSEEGQRELYNCVPKSGTSPFVTLQVMPEDLAKDGYIDGVYIGFGTTLPDNVCYTTTPSVILVGGADEYDCSADIYRVKFHYTRPDGTTRDWVDKVAPYTLFSNVGNDFATEVLELGTHTIEYRILDAKSCT